MVVKGLEQLTVNDFKWRRVHVLLLRTLSLRSCFFYVFYTCSGYDNKSDRLWNSYTGLLQTTLPAPLHTTYALSVSLSSAAQAMLAVCPKAEIKPFAISRPFWGVFVLTSVCTVSHLTVHNVLSFVCRLSPKQAEILANNEHNPQLNEYCML